MNKRLLSCLSAVIITCVSASAQTFKHEIDLSGLGDPSTTSKPFGASYNEANGLLYVAIAGSFAANNNVVAVIDPATDLVVATIPVGLFPEDIAFDSTTGDGAVTNSTSGSVTFFDSANSVLSTLQLPDPFGIGSCYPFGITYHDGHYFVGTVDGSGEVYAIDATTRTLAPSYGFATNYKSIGRMATKSSKLLVTTTEYNSTWSGATGGVYAHEMFGASTGRQINYVTQENLGTYPSASDMTPAIDGVFMTGLDFDGMLYITDDNGAPIRAIDAHGHNGYSLATSADATLLAMCELTTGTVVFFDAVNEEYVGAFTFSGMPNAAAFTPDKLYVTDQANERVMVFDQLPSFTDRFDHDGSLSISDSAPSLGDTVTVNLNGNPQETVWIVGASSATATTFNGVDFLIGPNLINYGSNETTHSITRTIPNNPTLSGRHFFLQGAIRDNNVIRTTKPLVLIIQ
ncbi:MAG: YncE family protein [Planctomycetota bacterium]